MNFQDKFIAFVDILGWTSLVEASERDEGMPLPELLGTLAKLGTSEDESTFARYGPTTCPQSFCRQKNLDFKVTQISDCVIVSAEASPAGLINLISHCWGAVIELLMRGLMCRGHITRGNIYHQNGQIVGSGYQKAYVNEAGASAFKTEADERGTPFVEIDPVVTAYVQNDTDECVRKMFSRMVKTEGGTTALFPFQQLSHQFIVSGFGIKFDPDKERAANDDVRQLLFRLRKLVFEYVDQSNPSAVRKAKHYVRALDAQFEVCERIDDIITIWTPSDKETR